MILLKWQVPSVTDLLLGQNDDIAAIRGRKESITSSPTTGPHKTNAQSPLFLTSGSYSQPKGRAVACSVPEPIRGMEAWSPPLPFHPPKPTPPSRRCEFQGGGGTWDSLQTHTLFARSMTV